MIAVAPRSTVREHLEALVRQGLVRRRRATPDGRGRPAWLYQASGAAEGAGDSEYARLATALASVIHRTSASPARDGSAAGAEWGRELACDRRARNGGANTSANTSAETDSAAARREVVSLLDELGFAAEPEAGHRVVRLTRCPLLAAAHRFSDVVCAVHHGIVTGALIEYATDPSGTDLWPFVEPGACLLDLPVAQP